MKTKDKIKELLEKNMDKYLSGEDIARKLYVTRACVWKNIKALQNEGYNIDAVTNKGYRLMLQMDCIDSKRLSKAVGKIINGLKIIYYDEVTSTNDIALEYARSNIDDAVIVARSQTKGRGRRGRSFFSPSDTGIYLSILLHPRTSLSENISITAIAAVAVAKAIDEIAFGGDDKSKIKWVNDIFIDGKKVAGILTEGYTSYENATNNSVIVGIGINVFKPEDGFPKNISKTAGYVLKRDKSVNEQIKEKLAAAVITNFFKYYNENAISKDDCLAIYKNKSFLEGCYIKINPFNGDSKYAYVTGISDDYHLQVRYDDGKTDELSTGEVSVVKY